METQSPDGWEIHLERPSLFNKSSLLVSKLMPEGLFRARLQALVMLEEQCSCRKGVGGWYCVEQRFRSSLNSQWLRAHAGHGPHHTQRSGLNRLAQQSSGWRYTKTSQGFLVMVYSKTVSKSWLSCVDLQLLISLSYLSPSWHYPGCKKSPGAKQGRNLKCWHPQSLLYFLYLISIKF